MSKYNIRPYWPFSQVKISNFVVLNDGSKTMVQLKPDQRISPICCQCHQPVRQIHSYHRRTIRDLSMTESIVLLTLHYRKVRCPRCGIRIEQHDFVEPYARVTKRLAQYIFDLCQLMTVSDVAKTVKLNWHLIKQIDKQQLQQLHGEVNYQDLKLLCIDEISIKKHHHYLTIIANYLTGQVISVQPNRDCDALSNFFKQLPVDVLNQIEAVAMDMWDPYIKAVKQYCPHAAIVFDAFHVIAAFGRVIDKIRNIEYRNADFKSKVYMKRSRFLLLKNPQNLSTEERPRLRSILRQNDSLAKVYILKEYLKRLWQYKSGKWAEKFLSYWCQLASELAFKELEKFVNMLKNYSYGIISHAKFAIHTSKLEGINNKIKVIKRKAYGYRDIEYFSLKIIHATCN